MSEPTTIKINEVEYVRKDAQPKPSGKIKIVILQRGWVFVGYWTKNGSDCTLENAHNIRVWGTTKGLGELALNGKTSKTILDPCGTMYFHELTTIAVIDCEDSKWSL